MSNKKEFKKVEKEINNLIDNTVPEAMGDDDIKKYFGQDTKIITYDKLKNYNSIDHLLPKSEDYVFLLYLDDVNNGHWCLLNKYKSPSSHIIEFFDSYGGSPDSQLKWVSAEKRKSLGVEKPYLTNLMNECPYPVFYNEKKYQALSNNKIGSINSCGRHCTYRLMNLIKERRNLAEYNEHLEYLKKHMKISYDEIVSGLINKMTE